MATLQEIANKVVEIGLVGDIDPIRSIKGKYKTLDDNNVLVDLETNDLVSKLFEVGITPKINTSTYPEILNNVNNFNVNKETILLSFSDLNISNFLRSIGIESITRVLISDFKEKLKIAILNKIANIDFLPEPQIDPKIFEDYSFDYRTPYSLKEQTSYNFGLSDYYDINSNYNFYEQKYEDSLSYVNEKIIPNLYLTQATSSFATKHSQLQIENGFAGPVNLISSTDFTNGFYFDAWGKNIANYKTIYNSTYNKTINQVNYFAINSNFNILSDNENKRENFPFFNKINFTTDAGSVGINRVIYDMNINCSFINTCLKEGVNTVLTFGAGALGGQIEKTINIVQNSNVVYDANNIPNIIYQYEKSNFIGLEFDFMNVLSSSIYDGNRPTIPLTTESGIQQVPIITYLDECTDTNTSSVSKAIMNALSKIRIATLVENQQRSYGDLYNRKLSKNETILYSVRKLLGGAPIQSLIFMNPLELKNFLYYDTQIKYNEKYTYEVDAYQVVVGTKYIFDDYEVVENLFTMNCYSVPSIKIVQTRYFQKDVVVCDSPPIPLDIQFIPYFGINNKMSFYMTNQVGRQIAEPTIIFDEDVAFFNSARESQEKLTGPILFESDDIPRVFQILRLEIKPTSYTDFKNASIINIDTLDGSFSNSYLETLQPNKYYYYTFRTVDIHNLISNPTPVYEIRIVDDAGAVYPEINVIYNFSLSESTVSQKTFKKYINLVPPIQQTLINIEQEIESALDIVNPKLGLVDDSVWDKKFKIRIKSKSTGKIVDLNVTFLKNKIN